MKTGCGLARNLQKSRNYLRIPGQTAKMRPKMQL